MIFRFLLKKKKDEKGKKKVVKKSAPAKKTKKKNSLTKRKSKAPSLKQKKAIKPALPKKEKNIQRVGKVTHYFPKVKAAVIKITKGPVKAGDTLYIKGHTTEFKQKVASMQIEHKIIKSAKKSDLIGLRVKHRVRHNDIVFKEF